MTEDPARIGRYDIVSVLGRGAMGVVYRAHDPEIDRPVAIKLVHAFLLSGEEQAEFVARFRREAQAAARCAHPNVVAVYDFALHDGDPFLAMEFVDGLALSAMRARGERMDPAQAVAIVRQVLAGLGAAHAGGITHRDVKPANIMLTRSGQAKIADFGISRLDASSLTASGMMVGTPSYMSPEQCRGEIVDPRSDLYSAGVVLYELLAGARPFEGTTSGALYVRLATEDAPDIRTHRPDLPPALADAVMRALDRDRDRRFPSAAAMAEALLPVAQGDGTIVMPGRSALPQASFAVDPDLLATLERRLAEHVGPIARYFVQSAVQRTTDFDSLCRKLAENIDQQAARDRFTTDVRAAGSASGSQIATGRTQAFDPAQLDRLQAALARHVGPVARVLIKRAKATTLPALWQEMAGHLDQPGDRTAFLRDAPPA